jgi:hypothetical protein
MERLLPIVFNKKLKVNSVDAMDLYEALNPKTRFNDWVTDKIDYTKAVKNEDYLIKNDDILDKSYPDSAITENSVMKNIEQLSSKNVGGIAKHKRKDYILSVHLAKEFAMLERNDTGREVRKYFIRCEEQLIELLKKKQEAPKPAVRYSYDSLAEKHKELCSHFRTWFSRKAKRPPTDKEVADFIIEVNMVCLGEETNTRSHLTLEGAYRIQNGCQILINQFKKGYRNTERFKSMFIEYYGSTDINKTLIPKEERLELVERLSIEG